MQQTPELIQPAPDLDGDGTGDLVFVVQPDFLLAVSGKDGKPLWCRRLGEAQTRLLGPPLVVADVDGDGRPDLIVAHGVFSQSPRKPGDFSEVLRALRPSVEALSGRTGATLWRQDGESQSNLHLGVWNGCAAENGFFGLWAQVATVTIGTAPQWPPVLLPLMLEVAQRKEDRLHGIYPDPWYRLWLAGNEAHIASKLLGEGEPKFVPLPRRCASLKERPTGQGRMVLAGLYRRLECLDLHTGREVAAPLPLDGLVQGWSEDGAVALVGKLFPSGTAGGITLDAVATAGGARTWSSRTDYGPVLFADLDRDGRPETVTPLGVLDGATGRERWENRSARRAGGAVVVGPDLDGDGWRDVFVASVVDGQPFGHPAGHRVLIAEVRSGKDGRALWRSVEPLPADGPSGHPPTLHTPRIASNNDEPWGPSPGPDLSGPALFWQCAPGTPGFFVVNVDVGWPGFDPDAVGRAFLFPADTGRLAHVWPGVTAAGTADLDGDGRADLYGYGGGKLYAIRGTTPEVWRRPGWWRPFWPTGEQAPPSGKTPFGPLYFAPPLPVGDLDGDGVADVLLFRPSDSLSRKSAEVLKLPTSPKEPVLQAYSGKDGRRLWQYDPPHLFDENGNYGAPEGIFVNVCRLLHCVDLRGDGRLDVVFAYGGPTRNKNGECRLVILDGRTGRVRWQKVGLSGSTPYLVSQGTSGGKALVVAIEEEFRALGADGRTIQTWPRRPWPDKSERPKELTRVRWPAAARVPWQGMWLWDRLRRERWLGDIDTSDGLSARLYSPHDAEDVTYCRGSVPLKSNVSGTDPRLSVPLPWAERSPQRWLPALGAGLAYLALVGGFALARRWRLGLLLLAWMVVLPAVTMWWQFDEAHRLFADERRDWAGWYWFWPDRLSCWAGWETLTNPLVGASAWFVLWVIVRRPWRSRTARTGG